MLDEALDAAVLLDDVPSMASKYCSMALRTISMTSLSSIVGGKLAMETSAIVSKMFPTPKSGRRET